MVKGFAASAATHEATISVTTPPSLLIIPKSEEREGMTTPVAFC